MPSARSGRSFDEMTDRIFGAYIGAAISDAMGGPIESWHAQRIRQTHGIVDYLLPHPPERVMPAFALHPQPGCVTDDTYIRDDVTQFVLRNPRPEQRTPAAFAEYLLWHMTLERWWHAPIDLMVKIHRGEIPADQGGDREPIGGRVGSWTSLGMIWAGQPARAASEVRTLGKVYKSALERDLAGAVQAGAAAAVSPGATVDKVIDAMLGVSGGRSRALITRAAEAGRRHRGDLEGLVDEVYRRLLIDYVPNFMQMRDTEGLLPEPSHAGSDIMARTASAFFAEQVPLAVAGFVWGEGDYRRTVGCLSALGRDNDSIATSAGTWIGGLVGLSGLPRDLVSAVIAVNSKEIDFLNDAWRLSEMALENLEAAGR